MLELGKLKLKLLTATGRILKIKEYYINETICTRILII